MGPFIFQSALWGVSVLEVPFLTPVVTRLPLGLGVAPKCLILDAFLEVFHLGEQFIFSWPGVREWISTFGPTPSRGLQSCWNPQLFNQYKPLSLCWLGSYASDW